MAEVNNLLDWGMTDNYDQELEHSAMGGGTCHRGRCIPTPEDGHQSSTIQ